MYKHRVVIRKVRLGHIVDIDNDYYALTSDGRVAKVIGFGYIDYCNYISDNFNAHFHEFRGMIFDTEEDAQAAKDWVESILLMKALSNA